MNIIFLLKGFKESLSVDNKFFRYLKTEDSIKKGLIYFIVLSFIAIGISLFSYTSRLNENILKIYELTGVPLFNFAIDVTWSSYLFVAIFLVILVTLLTFVRYYIIHYFILLHEKKAVYKDSYNSLSFSITPGYLAIIFFSLAFTFWSFDLFLTNIFASILFILYLILEIYSIYIRSKALGDIHNLTILKSFLCIYVYSSLAILFAFMLFLGILILIYA